MADLKRWPMALNQPGYDYPAELFRAEHHDATSGGNGVGAPTALKVTAQAAADGTVSILPGGATVKSTYAGADGQSYHARNFQPFTLSVPPTGSASGGRTDLLILRVCDPQYDVHPDHGGGEISEEEAANLDFWWFELLQGKNRNTSLSYPHVKLAEIVRPANTTIVTSSHIRDLRELAKPNSDRFVRSFELGSGTAIPPASNQSSGSWVAVASQSVEVPDWASTAFVNIQLAGCYIRGLHAHGWMDFRGLGSQGGQSRVPWDLGAESNQYQNWDPQTTDQLSIPSSMRGTVQTVSAILMNRPTSHPDSVIGTTSITRAIFDIQFGQEIA